MNTDFSSSLVVTGLKCEYAENPLGIDVLNPRLSWLLQSNQRAKRQTAYRILVASSMEKLDNLEGDLWDTGKVFSDASVNIKYQGKTLESGMRCYWKVRVWDEQDSPSQYSSPSWWEMGLLSPSDWQGNWIGAGSRWKPCWAPMLRKEFSLDKRVKSARAYICGLGYYELYLNGHKVGDHVLDPGQTDYELRAFYVTYDVTDMLHKDNAVGIILGDGWYSQSKVWHGFFCYGQPKVILQTNIVFEDGTRAAITTDNTWKCSDSPITLNNVYAGETYDARLEQPGWNYPNFDDSCWHQAEILDEPGGKLVAQMLPPIKRMKVIKPIKLTQPRDGVYVYDMGQNFAGWARLTVQGSSGTEVVLRYAEEVDDNGIIDPSSTGTEHTCVVQTDRYILKGEGIEVWEPRFTYHGFRYVEVVGFPGVPTLENLEGVVVYTAVEQVGEFDCSDQMLNKIHEVIKWTQTSNLHSIPEDCPAREKCGWLGDAQVSAETTIYNWDMASFWTKYLGDIKTTRTLNQTWMMIAPGKRLCGEATPAWGTTQVQLPWYLYLYYGDMRILHEYYEDMKAWTLHLLSKTDDYIVSYGNGDWCPPGSVEPKETPVPLTSTAYLFYDASIMAKVAKLTGNAQDAEEFERLAEATKNAFNKKFFDYEAATYGSQTADSFALYLNLVPEGKERAVADNLVRNIMVDNDGHFTTGIIGLKYMFGVLTDFGYGSVAQTVLNKTTYPSFGHLFSLGATTLWETWEKYTPNVSVRSRNHPMQGGLDPWFYSHIAGILPDEDYPGFKRIIIKPNIIGTLTYANGTYRSVHGTFASSWKMEDNTFKLKISIPPNTSATVYVPTKNDANVLESGIPAKQAKGVQYIETEQDGVIYQVGSGTYEFTCLLNDAARTDG